MRTAFTIAATAVLALATGTAFAEHEVSKADYYHELYVDTLVEARVAAEKGHWDEYNELYQKAQYYRREYEFYRYGAARYPVTTHRIYTPSPYYYSPGLSLSFGHHGGRHSARRHHRSSSFRHHSSSRHRSSSFRRHSGSRLRSHGGSSGSRRHSGGRSFGSGRRGGGRMSGSGRRGGGRMSGSGRRGGGRGRR